MNIRECTFQSLQKARCGGYSFAANLGVVLNPDPCSRAINITCQYSRIVQQVERRIVNPNVGGSSPSPGVLWWCDETGRHDALKLRWGMLRVGSSPITTIIKCRGVSVKVAHQFWELAYAGSSPVTPTKGLSVSLFPQTFINSGKGRLMT